MKKTSILISFLMLFFACSPEESNINNHGAENNPCPAGAVDLGLSVYWATCNLSENGFVGSPEEYGDYYAWGEVETHYSSQDPLTWKPGKAGYEWTTYKWSNGSSNSLTKYNIDSSHGTVDNKTVLDTDDDVAHVKLGGNWRMPTDEEWSELIKCTSLWTSQNGVYGRKVTGPNGNSIFLPAAGWWSHADITHTGTDGLYWSSSLNTEIPNTAWRAYFTSEDIKTHYAGRHYGLSIRPVTK